MKSLNLSFDATSLREQMEVLPDVPPWKCKAIALPGYETVEPIRLYYRDTEACVRHLFSNPIFKGKIDLAPFKLYDHRTKIRRYGTMLSADWANLVQASLFYLLIDEDRTNIPL